MNIIELRINEISHRLYILSLAPASLDNYIAVYRCALKVADIMVSSMAHQSAKRPNSRSKNVWIKLEKWEQFTLWSQYFLNESRYVHRLEDGLVRWLSDSKYLDLINHIQHFIHEIHVFLNISHDCVCLSRLVTEEGDLDMVS